MRVILFLMIPPFRGGGAGSPKRNPLQFPVADWVQLSDCGIIPVSNCFQRIILNDVVAVGENL